ncbi:MAG: hypothetical protein HDS62_04740 [Bacteroidales bacterium]|nr:hypothetical protein [Bacteroidales bacterium]
MNQRTKYFQLRLTPEEYTALKSKAEKYNSVSEYIRTALQEFSDLDTQERIRMMTDLGQFYRDYNNRLSWTRSNLNQAVKRANELAIGGQLTGTYITTILMPLIEETNTLISELKRQLLTLTKTATKF